MTRPEFDSKVDTLCDLYGGSVTSGRRTTKHNAAVGGVDRSRHLKEHGFAADILPDDRTPTQRGRIRAAAGLMGLVALDSNGGAVHVHWPPAGEELHD